MTRHIIYIIYTLLLTTYLGYPQKVEVDAPREVEVGRPFTVTYLIGGNVGGQLSIAQQPSHTGLELLYGPTYGESRSVSLIGDKVTASVHRSYTYTFLASATGSFSVSGFSVELSDGRTINAPSWKLQALAQPKASTTQGHSTTSRQYHYLALVGKRSVYEQEAIPITYKLYAQSSFNFVDTQAPVYDGFISYSLKDRGPTQIMREEYKGQLYNTVEVYKELLYPQKSGRLEIPRNRTTIQIPLEVDDSPFLGQLEDRTLATQPIIIEVKPLPQANKPQDFSGAVGEFVIQSSLSTKTPKTNEAFTLRYVLQGSGNLKMAQLPQLVFPEELEVYPPTDHTEEISQSSDLIITRTIEYSVIPRSVGRYTLPAFSLSYFDPKTAQYKRLQTAVVDIVVAQGKVVEDEGLVVGTSQGSEDNSAYLLSYRMGTSVPLGLGFVTSVWYPLCYLLIALLGLGGYLCGRKLIEERADVWGYAALRANSEASKRLRLAYKYCKEGNQDAFYEEALRAMWEYVGARLMLPSSELSRARVAELLSERGIASEEVAKWKQTMDDIEYARFAPTSSQSNPHTLYDRAVEIIAHIESHIQ